jgi:hypothetical protein
MPQYMLSVHHTTGVPLPDFSSPEVQAAFEATGAFNEKLMASGNWVFGGGLEMPETATTVKAHDGDLLITDGPFAESKEFLGGFWVIEAPDLDAALALAQEASVACRETVELRPFQAEPDA